MTNTYGNAVEIRLKDGTVLSAWGRVQGSTWNPVMPQDVVAKFRKITALHLSPTAQDQLIDMCNRLDAVEDATALVTMLELRGQ